MLGQLEIPGIPTAEEEGRANFKLDTEKSFALLVITPIHAVSDDGETDYIDVKETIEIKPYPNPYGFGGMWGSGSRSRGNHQSREAEAEAQGKRASSRIN